MTSDLIAVTGATGGIGGRVARRLAARGIYQRLIARDPSRVPQLPNIEVSQAAYRDIKAMKAALLGVHTLLLVSASEDADRVAEHFSAVEGAVTAGVQRIVYISFLGADPEAAFTLARHHWKTEQRIRATGRRYTLLRDSLYLDYLRFFVGPDGVIRGPAGDGRVAAVARDDIADAAVEVLLGEGHDYKVYNLTGPQALTLHGVAAERSRLSGRDIRYHPESLEEAFASRAHFGAPDWEVEGWVTSYSAIAQGQLEIVSDHVRRLTGRRPLSLTEYLAANPDDLAALKSSDQSGADVSGPR